MASSSRDIEPFTRWKILTIITTMHLNFSNQVLCKFIFLVICVTSYFIFIYKLLFGSWTIRGWESWEKFIKVKASYTETAFVIYDIDDDLFFFSTHKDFRVISVEHPFKYLNKRLISFWLFFCSDFFPLIFLFFAFIFSLVLCRSVSQICRTFSIFCSLYPHFWPSFPKEGTTACRKI